MQAQTPAQRQYHELKNAYPDCVLLFRMGDFYETFYEDAHIAHAVLHITLTSRDKNSTTPVPMAGIPYHALERYLPKLIKAGYKVAIAEQQGPVIPGKIVSREVTQVITPGTFIEEGEGIHYIAALAADQSFAGRYHLAWGDVSLGTYRTKSVVSIEEALETLLLLDVKELLVDPFLFQGGGKEYVEKAFSQCTTIVEVPHNAEGVVCASVGVSSLQGYGQAVKDGRIYPIAQIFSYLSGLQGLLFRVTSISYAVLSTRVVCDAITFKNLEVFHSSYDSSSTYTLFGILNTCATPMGSRCLHGRLSSPIRSLEILEKRFAQIEYFVENSSLAHTLHQHLKRLPDIPRVLSRVLNKQPSFSVLVSLKKSLAVLFEESQIVSLFPEYNISSEMTEVLTKCLELLQTALTDEPAEDGSRIQPGFNDEIDRLRQLAYHADELLITYQQEVQQTLGISMPKVRFVTNQGYFLEVSKKDSETLEHAFQKENRKFDFVRRQTLKTGERYVTSYLQELQASILNAQQELQQVYGEVRMVLVDKIRVWYDVIMHASDGIAALDVALTLGVHSKHYRWCKPQLHTGYDLIIEQGRHPVVEEFLPTHEQFIPNDLQSKSTAFFHLITGPNMGGKSTYLRQNALIVLMAHSGCRVPATSAVIPLVDGIFARVGSGDVLAKNQSTFLTEMLEMANILNNATKNSFVVLDELGRGTSTYDGLSLAKSICVYMVKHLGCKTLFATHYHELQNLEKELLGFRNMHVSVYENDHEIVFLKKITEGGADRSYGLEVAKLAGIPHDVITNAKVYLQQLQQAALSQREVPVQLGFEFSVSENDDRYSNKIHQVYQTIRDIVTAVELDTTTPLDALLLIREIKKIFE